MSVLLSLYISCIYLYTYLAALHGQSKQRGRWSRSRRGKLCRSVSSIGVAIWRDRYVQLQHASRAAASARTIAVATGVLAPPIRPAMDCRLVKRTNGRRAGSVDCVQATFYVQRQRLEPWRQSPAVYAGLTGAVKPR